MDRPNTVDMSSAALLRDALGYVEHVVQCINEGRLDHAELDANRAAGCLREVARRQAGAE